MSSEQTLSPEKSKYWQAALKDGKPKEFDKMPTVDEPARDPYQLHEIYPQWRQKYGPIMRQLEEDGKYTVHTFHFDDFDTVYSADGAYYTKTGKMPERKSHQILKVYREKNPEKYENVGLGPGIDGPFVPRIRKYIKRSLQAGIDEDMEQVADDLIEKIHSKVGKGGRIDLKQWLLRWGFENVGWKFLDKRLGALYQPGSIKEADKMVEAAAKTNEAIAVTTLFPKHEKYDEYYETLETHQDYFYDVLKKYIDEVKSNPDSKCAVKNILEGKDDKVKEWENLEQRRMSDAITVSLDGFQGALQTIALTVLMALYNLARNKDIQEQAREEVKKHLPRKDSKFRTDRFPEIIKNIVNETLRFSPPIIGNGRIIKTELVLGGFKVPKETNVIMHFQVASRLEEFYENPLTFDPNRFNSKNTKWVDKIFSFGVRQCVGQYFARHSMKLLLLKMLRNFEFSYEGGEIAMQNRLHNEPKVPLVLQVTPLPE